MQETYPELSKRAHNVATRVLYQRPRDNLQRVRNGPIRPRLNPRHAPRLILQSNTNRHLRRTPTRRQRRIENHVPRHAHSISKIPIDLVQNVFGRTAQEDGAGFGRRAFGEEREVLVADLLDVEEPAFRADVRLAQVLDAVHDRTAHGARDAVVVGFAHAAERGDAGFGEEVLRVV